MRDLILELVQNTDTGILAVSQELPYSVDGTALYLKNAKKIYVDLAQITRANFITTLDNQSISNITTSIKVFFSNEAKTIPGYDDIVTNLASIKDSTGVRSLGYVQRNCTSSTEYIDNMLVTTLEFEFTKIS